MRNESILFPKVGQSVNNSVCFMRKHYEHWQSSLTYQKSIKSHRFIMDVVWVGKDDTQLIPPHNLQSYQVLPSVIHTPFHLKDKMMFIIYYRGSKYFTCTCCQKGFFFLVESRGCRIHKENLIDVSDTLLSEVNVFFFVWVFCGFCLFVLLFCFFGIMQKVRLFSNEVRTSQHFVWKLQWQWLCASLL